MRKATAVAALRRQRLATISLLASLPDAAWERPGEAGDGLNVHGLAAHLVVADEALLVSRWLSGREGARRLANVVGWHDGGLAAWSSASPGEVLAALARNGDRVAAMVRATPSAAVNLRASGAQGRRSFLLQALGRRVLHEFAHRDDIAVAAGVGRDLEGPSRPVADALTFTVLQQFPAEVLPTLAVDSGVVRLAIDPMGASACSPRVRSQAPGLQTWSFDFARKQYGPRVSARPDATIAVAADALALLRTGRRCWRALTPAQLSVAGDAALAAVLLDAVATPRLASGSRTAPAA
ncbi:hypothetical protein BH20ACT7_BH20ACT7_04200 [soil metagenome]|jgi:hypothetical protein